MVASEHLTQEDRARRPGVWTKLLRRLHGSAAAQQHTAGICGDRQTLDATNSMQAVLRNGATHTSQAAEGASAREATGFRGGTSPAGSLRAAAQHLGSSLSSKQRSITTQSSMVAVDNAQPAGSLGFTFAAPAAIRSPLKFAARKNPAQSTSSYSQGQDEDSQSCEKSALRNAEAASPVMLDDHVPQRVSRHTSHRGKEAVPLAFSSKSVPQMPQCSLDAALLPAAMVCDQACNRTTQAILGSTLAQFAAAQHGETSSLGSAARSSGIATGLDGQNMQPVAEHGDAELNDGPCAEARSEQRGGTRDGPAAGCSKSVARSGNSAHCTRVSAGVAAHASAAAGVGEEPAVNLERLKLMAGFAPVLAGGRRVCLRKK